MLKAFITYMSCHVVHLSFQFSSLAIVAAVFEILVVATVDADLFGELFGDNLSNRMSKGGKGKGLSRLQGK